MSFSCRSTFIALHDTAYVSSVIYYVSLFIASMALRTHAYHTHRNVDSRQLNTNILGLINRTLMSEEATSAIPRSIPKFLAAGQRCSSLPWIFISEKYRKNFQGT